MNEWVEISLIVATDEEGNEYIAFNCELPEDGEEIVVTDGENAWHDVCVRDGGNCSLRSGLLFGGDVVAWRREEVA